MFVSVGPMPPTLKRNPVKLLKIFSKPIAFYHRIGRLLSAYAKQELLHLLLYETLVLYTVYRSTLWNARGDGTSRILANGLLQHHYYRQLRLVKENHFDYFL